MGKWYEWERGQVLIRAVRCKEFASELLQWKRDKKGRRSFPRIERITCGASGTFRRNKCSDEAASSPLALHFILLTAILYYLSLLRDSTFIILPYIPSATVPI